MAELDRSWETPKPSSVGVPPTATPELQAALDAAADRLAETLEPFGNRPASVASMDELDSGWEGDDGQNDDDDDDEPEESEPELPDEKLDPVAYAAAAKARDERIEARRERKRVKLEAKKARRKARIDAARGKQKGKTRKARPVQATPAPSAKKLAKAAKAAQARARAGSSESVSETPLGEVIDIPDRPRGKAPPSRPITKKPMLSGTNAWMLAIALVVFVAAAIFVAVVTR